MFDSEGEIGIFAQAHATIKALNGSWSLVTVRNENDQYTRTYRAQGRRHIAAILLHSMRSRKDVSESRH
jgi:hypothetical protein